MSRRTLALVTLVLAPAMLAACAAEAVHPAVARIADLLELRRDDVRDPEAFEEYFSDPVLAAALVQGSTGATGTPQVPEYEPPYLTAETTSTADVVVVWEASDDFVAWPAVTVFVLSLEDERWVVVDAFEATSAPEPLDPVPSE